MSQRLIVTFRKGGGSRYLSHLDLMATLEFAVRRARLPVALAEGFNPRPRLSLAAPLPLGHVGEAEILEITLTEELEPDEVRDRLRASVSEGIEILSVEQGRTDVKSAASRVRTVVYRVDLPQPVEDLAARIAALMARPTVEVQEERDGGTRSRDVRPHMRSLEAIGPQSISAILDLAGSGTVRPEQILELLCIDSDGARFVRERIDLDQG